MYSSFMDVGIAELRANLGTWIDLVRNGDEVVVTERGTPVARIVGVSSASALDRLTREGVIGRPTRSARPVAGARPRPTPVRPVSDRVDEQRR